MPIRYTIQVDNQMYWSNTTSIVAGMSKITTLALEKDPVTSFKIGAISMFSSGKYVIMYQPDNTGVYLRWDAHKNVAGGGTGQYAVITASAFSSTTDWESIPSSDKPNLTFAYTSVDLALEFQLSVYYNSQTLYFKRVSWGDPNNVGQYVQYLQAEAVPDQYGIFTKGVSAPLVTGGLE